LTGKNSPPILPTVESDALSVLPCRYITRREAALAITEYIEIFYNRQRKQARLGFMAPASLEKWFHEKQLAA
jgi:transposase InsO family protein